MALEVVVWEVVALAIPKSCYLYFSFSGNNNVLWFDIPVYNMIIMGNLQSCRYMNCNTGCLFDGQAAFSLNIILQSDSFHQLHHNIIDTVLITDIIYIYNIGMSKPGLLPELPP